MPNYARVPVILTALLLGLGGGMASNRMAEAPFPYADISPAAGGGQANDSGDHGPKRSHSGKVLSAEPTIPQVDIGLQRVMTSEMLYQKELKDATPDALKGDLHAELLRRRLKINTFTHNPVTGPADAPLTVLEITDLSCVPCMSTLTEIDRLMEAHPGAIRLINMYTPANRFNGVNLAAFYSKVAQRGGVFWEYRNALQTLTDPTPEAYFETLMASGMDRLQARRLLTTEARRFYRELDADATLTKQLSLNNPPHVYVNGLHVGENGIALNKLADVVAYELNRPTDNGGTQP